MVKRFVGAHVKLPSDPIIIAGDVLENVNELSSAVISLKFNVSDGSLATDGVVGNADVGGVKLDVNLATLDICKSSILPVMLYAVPAGCCPTINALLDVIDVEFVPL
ncbi:MAG: hypothetical protein BWY74_02720 [Firmicutes bacterium ADurb.Bin419]|nr:MAG: hypothetical protein BWY74_02720 [Firmicutes bacterium ADurb.Bin419]